MKEMTRRNLSSVKGAQRVPISAFQPPFDHRAIYAFIDDDDWFSPNLAEALLGSRDALKDGVIWRSSRFDGQLSVREHDGFCYTNNYAVTGRLLAADAEAAPAVCQHLGTQAKLHRSHMQVWIPGLTLSVTNKHPCSTMSLKRAMHDRMPLHQLVQNYSDFLSTPLQAQVVDEGLAWALPLMREVAQTLSESAA